MYSTVKRWTLLKRVTGDGGILPVSSRMFLPLFRNSSELQAETATQSEKDAFDIASFSRFLRDRQEEASRSVVLKVHKAEDWENVYNICSKCGTLSRIYHYKVEAQHFVLVEMKSKEELTELFHGSTNNIFPPDSVNCKMYTFGIFNEKRKLQSVRSYEADIEKVLLNVPIRFRALSAVLSNVKVQTALSNQISEFYEQIKINDLGMRLRFMMIKQVQSIINGIIPGAVVLPFGSSVNGVGINGCDLDLVILNDFNDNSVVKQNQQNISRPIMQAQLDILSDILKFFVIGSSDVIYIKNARVPIVKYKHLFAGTDCDLSLYCDSAVKMSQILYLLTSFDERAKQLILFIKMWAKKMNLTHGNPGPWMTNFSLTMLIIFFLQQSASSHSALLPPLNIFPINDSLLIDENKAVLNLQNFRHQSKRNTKSIANILHLFFKFYSSFDFENYGCCVKTGRIIDKMDSCALYIRNPLDQQLNVSKNISWKELQKFVHLVTSACRVFESNSDNHTTLSLNFLFNAKNFVGPINVKNIFS